MSVNSTELKFIVYCTFWRILGALSRSARAQEVHAPSSSGGAAPSCARLRSARAGLAASRRCLWLAQCVLGPDDSEPFPCRRLESSSHGPRRPAARHSSVIEPFASSRHVPGFTAMVRCARRVVHAGVRACLLIGCVWCASFGGARIWEIILMLHAVQAPA